MVLAVLFFTVLCSLGVDRARAASDQEQEEPNPWPQSVLSHSDYSEARQLLNKRKWAEATVVLRAVLRRTPDFLPAAIELARALVYSGRREEALTMLMQQASRQSGARREVLEDRAQVIARLFLTTRTHQIYQEGLNLLSDEKYRPAREKFELALEGEPDNVEILTRIGQCLVMDGDHDSAAERLRVARRLDPLESEVRLWLGRALHQRGELQEALSELKAAYADLTRSERAPLWYAEALVSSGNRKGAVAMLEEDVRSEPFHLPVIISLAKLRMELFREGADSLWSARKDLQVALSRLPQYGSFEVGRFEGEMGLVLTEKPTDLKERINTLLAQLDSRLQPEVTPPGPSSRRGSDRTTH